MLISCAFGLAFLKLQATEIRVANVRPSRLVAKLREALPIVDSVKADDAKSLVLVTGPKDVVDEVRQMVTMFDVRPLRVELRVNIRSEIDHAEFETTAKVANQNSWRVVDEATNVDLTVVPHINSDATVSLYLKTQRGKTTAQIVARTDIAHPIRLELDDKGSILGFFADELKPREGLKHPIIVITAKSIEEKGQPPTSHKLP